LFQGCGAGNLVTATRAVVVGSGASISSGTLTVGDTFTDAGATATDDVGGDISSDVVVSGAVDTATAGLYTRTYTVEDAAGNTASVSRIVTVKAPVEVVATTTPVVI